MIDMAKTKFHGDKFAKLLAAWDNVMVHIDESIVDTDLKGSIFEQQMGKSVEMIEYILQDVPAGTRRSRKQNVQIPV